jgi:hypothetical protein
MKPVVCLLGALIVTTAIGTPAHAQNYPWCAYYSGRGWAARPIVASPLFSNAWPR